MPRRHARTSWLLAAIPVILGLLFIGMSLLSYDRLRIFIDPLLPDHNFNSLKPWNAYIFKLLFLLAGVFLWGSAALIGFQRLDIVKAFLKQLFADSRRYFASLAPKKTEMGFLLALVVILVLGIIYRLEHIYSPLHHDEAYTYVAFSRSFFTAISDYHLPNNHVFHSILVFLSTKLLGIQPWVVRLPAFVAGVLCIPAGYWLAKRLYSRWIALGAAFLIAWFPPFIAYANNARGYTLVALFTLLILVLGDFVRKDKNSFAWGLISLFSALGMYTVPVMAFPIGVLYLWLFLENFIEGHEPYQSKKQFLWYWVASGLGSVCLTLLLYLPIFIYSGPASFFSNQFVAPLAWNKLWETLLQRFADTWGEWTFRVPVLIVIILVVGWILSLVFHRQLSKTRVPLQLATLLWIVALLLLERPNAYSKVWVFLQPLMLIWAAAGIFGLLEKIPLKVWKGFPLASIVLGFVLIAGVRQAVQLAPDLPKLWSIKGSEERAALFVKSQLREGDIVIVAPPDDAPVWYYSELHKIPDSYFDVTIPSFDRALVMVDPGENQTPEKVIEERGPETVPLDVGSAYLMGTFGKIQVFMVQR